jgi:hypothetical protein
MAAYFNLDALEATAASNRESAFDGRRAIGHRVRLCTTMAARVVAAVCEFGLFLWILAAVAWSLIVMAGFFVE